MTDDRIAALLAYVAQVRRDDPTAVVLFRLGDFYEALDRDAVTLHAVFGIRPLLRAVKGARVASAGIPYHAIDSYCATLADRGYTPVRCETPATLPIAAT